MLASEGSFVRAAEALGISQPSLSQYVKKIEENAGLPLFIRTGGDVRLTDAGRVYVEIGKQILDLKHQMENRFSDLAAHKTGSVIVGTSPFRSAAMMPQVVKKFRQLHPGMHVVVEEMTSTELLDAAEHGKFDICLTLLPADASVFTWETVSKEELVLAVPASFPAMHAESVPGRKYPAVSAEELDGLGFIMITESQFMQRALDRLCSDFDLHIGKAAVVKSLEAQIAMVRAGVGVALVPAGVEVFCSEQEVTYYSIRQVLPKRSVIALWRKDRALSLAACDLVKIMKDSAQ